MDQANATGRWTRGTAAIADRFAGLLDGVALSVDSYRYRAVAGADDDLDPMNALARRGAT